MDGWMVDYETFYGDRISRKSFVDTGVIMRVDLEAVSWGQGLSCCPTGRGSTGSLLPEKRTLTSVGGSTLARLFRGRMATVNKVSDQMHL